MKFIPQVDAVLTFLLSKNGDISTLSLIYRKLKQ